MGIKIISKNKRASFDYFLHDKYEAGIVLRGTEVKSLRAGKVSLSESFISIDANYEIWIVNMLISHYEFGNINNHQESRKRKLLLNKQEIVKIEHTIKTDGMTLVPLAIYFKNSTVKIEFALGKGKKHFDKRADNAQKDVKRKIQ